MTNKEDNVHTNTDNIRYVMVSPEQHQISNTDNEIDLKELWDVIWRGKWIIVLTTILFAVASVFYALSLPNIYKSQVLLAPASSEDSGGLGSISGQLGGLASLAGINLGGAKADKTGLAIEILKSRKFARDFIQKRNLLPDLMAAEGWDASSNTVMYNPDVYDAKSNEWLREVKPPRQSKPSFQEAYVVFSALSNVTQDDTSGMISISVEHHSPYVAKQWVDWLVEDINAEMKARDKQEAERSIAYLQAKIAETNIVEQKTLLYQLIEEQAKTLMFAEVRDEYVFKTIDPALVPELKFKPKRALIVIIGLMLGGILSVIFVLIRYFSSEKN